MSMYKKHNSLFAITGQFRKVSEVCIQANEDGIRG